MADNERAAYESCLVSILKLPFRSLTPFAYLTDIFVMLKFYPRDINYMPVVKFFACLDLYQVSEDSEVASFRTKTT